MLIAEVSFLISFFGGMSPPGALEGLYATSS